MEPESPGHLANIVEVLDALQCGAVLLDRNAVLIHANRRMGEMLRVDPKDLIGRDARTVWPGHKVARTIEEGLQRFDQDHEGEATLPLPGGKELPVKVAGRRLGHAPPFSDLRVITVMDISQRVLADNLLRDQHREVARLSDTMVEMAIELKHHSERLEQRVRDRTRELHEANMDAIYMLAVASEARDADTGAHVRRIQHYSAALARGLGLPDREAEKIGYSAILHDVGKIAVPDDILKKAGPLTDEERADMNKHTLAGEQILSNKSFFDYARQIARSHHENYDGTGYPDRRSKDAIPMAARIVRLADVYDALRSPRIYKPAWTHDDTVRAIRDGAGTLFDPTLVRIFLRLVSEGRFTWPQQQAAS
jgi:response regulator RpfG family c-di-GMP phosphodiesterase